MPPTGPRPLIAVVPRSGARLRRWPAGPLDSQCPLALPHRKGAAARWRWLSQSPWWWEGAAWGRMLAGRVGLLPNTRGLLSLIRGGIKPPALGPVLKTSGLRPTLSCWSSAFLPHSRPQVLPSCVFARRLFSCRPAVRVVPFLALPSDSLFHATLAGQAHTYSATPDLNLPGPYRDRPDTKQQ